MKLGTWAPNLLPAASLCLLRHLAVCSSVHKRTKEFDTIAWLQMTINAAFLQMTIDVARCLLANDALTLFACKLRLLACKSCIELSLLACLQMTIIIALCLKSLQLTIVTGLLACLLANDAWDFEAVHVIENPRPATLYLRHLADCSSVHTRTTELFTIDCMQMTSNADNLQMTIQSCTLLACK